MPAAGSIWVGRVRQQHSWVGAPLGGCEVVHEQHITLPAGTKMTAATVTAEEV